MTYQLIQGIISQSEAKTWDQAKTEWSLLDVFMVDKPQACLCGHFPIKELCVLKNCLNWNTVTVGNCCVKKFLGLPSDKIFQSVKRIRKDPSKSLNFETVGFAFEHDWINEWEWNFYCNVLRKRSLTPKQAAKKRQINEVILSKIAT